MCGYLGQISNQKIDKSLLEQCNENIVCRGPDEKKAYFLDDSAQNSQNTNLNIGFIFNRLSILDLTEDASQPMVSKIHNTVLMFNGEIYNHKILRAELENQNISFESDHSDTEVVLNGISYFGIDFVNKLIGQFSISFIDLNLNKLYLVKDRVGQKPLFYTKNNDSFFLGSNLKSIKQLSGKTSLDEYQLNKFLNYGVVTSPNTIYKGIFKVKPGEIIEIDLNTPNFSENKRIYWEPSSFVGEENFDNEEIMALMENSVDLRMKADVEIANFLSGGIDSTSIIKMAAKNHKLNTFSMSINESDYDESKWFNAVSNKFDTNHITINLDSQNLKNESIVESINIFDEPYSDPSTIPSYILSKEISKNYKVAISGDGGDELFGGYDRLRIVLQNNNLLKASLAKLYSVYPAHLGTGNRLLRNSKNINIAYPSFLEDKKLLDLLGVKAEFNFVEDYLENSDDFIKNILISDIKLYLSEMMMLKVDRTSMANSLEVRSPFVDHRLIEYVLSRKIDEKNIQNPKFLLKMYLEKDFGKEFVNRKKMGFVFDLENWIYKNIDFISNSIKNTEEFSNIDIKKVSMLYKNKSRINALRIWKLFFLSKYISNMK